MPREVMTIRLDRSFRLRLQAAAKRRSVTPSAAARVALEGWLAADEQQARSRPFDALADLIGSVRGGDPARSTRAPGRSR
jgi:predicted transcriptional regulator